MGIETFMKGARCTLCPLGDSQQAVIMILIPPIIYPLGHRQ